MVPHNTFINYLPTHTSPKSLKCTELFCRRLPTVKEQDTVMHLITVSASTTDRIPTQQWSCTIITKLPKSYHLSDATVVMISQHKALRQCWPKHTYLLIALLLHNT